MTTPTIAIIGLGYVGLPLAVYFAKYYKVIGIDIDKTKVEELKQSHDRMGEVEKKDLQNSPIHYTSNNKRIAEADYIIVTVPTPVDDDNMPDLTLVKQACNTVGKNLKKGATVVFESTVYPGCTEEICIPLLEQTSGLTLNKEFTVGYSPERVNPGDKKHTIDKVTKIVSGSNKETAKKLHELYGTITDGHIHVASNIKVAEAAKITENIQRDVNIALMNELAHVYGTLGINTHEVLAAASTKWNFHKYTPGLVGGHCIGVDPYYLLYKAEKEGYSPKIIRDARVVNDNMHHFYANQALKALTRPAQEATIALYGLTFKANCSDTRNSRAKFLAKTLKEKGVTVLGIDPYIDENTATRFNTTLTKATAINPEDIDVAIIIQAHKEFQNIDFTTFKQVIDIPGMLRK